MDKLNHSSPEMCDYYNELSDIEFSPIKMQADKNLSNYDADIKYLFNAFDKKILNKHPFNPNKVTPQPILGKIVKKRKVDHIDYKCGICKKNNHYSFECIFLCKKDVCGSRELHHKNKCVYSK